MPTSYARMAEVKSRWPTRARQMEHGDSESFELSIRQQTQRRWPGAGRDAKEGTGSKPSH